MRSLKQSLHLLWGGIFLQLISGPNWIVVDIEEYRDLHYRFGCVLNRVTKNMSKTNYLLPDIMAAISEWEESVREDAVRDAVEDGTVSRTYDEEPYWP